VHFTDCTCVKSAPDYNSQANTGSILSRDAILSRYRPMLTSCVRLSVRLSVTSRHCTKTAKHRITQTTPYDRPGTLVFYCQRSQENSNGVTPNGQVLKTSFCVHEDELFMPADELFLVNGQTPNFVCRTCQLLALG